MSREANHHRQETGNGSANTMFERIGGGSTLPKNALCSLFSCSTSHSVLLYVSRDLLKETVWKELSFSYHFTGFKHHQVNHHLHSYPARTNYRLPAPTPRKAEETQSGTLRDQPT